MSATKLTDTTKEQFRRFALTGAKYGRFNAKTPGLPQLRSLESAGLIVRGAAGTIDEITSRRNNLHFADRMSRPHSPATTAAMELVRAGVSVQAAAKQCGVARSTVWRALTVQRCPCCGKKLGKDDLPEQAKYVAVHPDAKKPEG